MNYNKKYKVWLFEDKYSEKQLRTWNDYFFNRSQFIQDKKEGKLIYIISLYGNQKSCELDSKGVYRNLYGKRHYIYNFK